jgi:LysR family glycine cleavage system transcriptional activator
VLPPLNSIKAFEAAARHLSFTKAAEELHVTAAALSHQVAGLEARLGTKLFHRRAHRITLTESGQLLYPSLHAAFQTIVGAFHRLDQLKTDNILVVNGPPGFVIKWLVPRLQKFSAVFPDIDLRISASRQRTNFDDGTDLAIRYVTRDVPRAQFHSQFLTKDVLVPLCSPSLLESMSNPPCPSDLAHQKLIHFVAPDDFPSPVGWTEWRDHIGQSGIDSTRGPRFYQPEHAIDAAVEGNGVALCYKVIALTDIDAGRLIVPFGPELEMGGMGYYLIYPKQRKDSAKIQAFCDWALGEITTESNRARSPSPLPRK